MVRLEQSKCEACYCGFSPSVWNISDTAYIILHFFSYSLCTHWELVLFLTILDESNENFMASSTAEFLLSTILLIFVVQCFERDWLCFSICLYERMQSQYITIANDGLNSINVNVNCCKRKKGENE